MSRFYHERDALADFYEAVPAASIFCGMCYDYGCVAYVVRGGVPVIAMSQLA